MDTQNLTNEQITNASENDLRRLVAQLRDFHLSAGPSNEVPQASPQIRPRPSFQQVIKPPKPDIYDGKRNNYILNTWLYSFKQYCDYYELDESTMVATAALWFRKDAATWWQFHESRVEQNTVHPISN